MHGETVKSVNTNVIQAINLVTILPEIPVTDHMAYVIAVTLYFMQSSLPL